jgi:DNA-directed RNA polymerase subunit alpha
MRIRWRGLELPTRVVCEKETLTESYGKFVIEPFERGFGTTVGNSLRRVLLSSLEGAAPTSVKIEGVQHEFSTIPGVVEDVSEIILNVKRIVLTMGSDHVKTFKIEAHKKGEVKAGAIETDSTAEVVNKGHHIATLSEKADFVMELTVRKGRGYVTAEENQEGEQVIGVIPVDSLFSPVLRVLYSIENTRVGRLTDYDRLIMEIWTDGSISPEMALVEATKILRKHLTPFVQYFETGREIEASEQDEEEELRKRAEVEELRDKLDRSVAELDLSVRASNCLQAGGIVSLRDLVSRTEGDMLKLRNFGKTSLKEVKDKLAELGVSLGQTAEE